MKILNGHKELLDAYSSENMVLFIGSGLSKEFDLPNWKELIIETINYIVSKTGNIELESLIPNINSGLVPPLMALEILQSKNYEEYCFDVITESLKIPSGAASSLHSLIHKACPQIITTNYDHAFENVIGDDVNKIDQENIYKLAKRKDNKPYLIKLHGDIDNPKKCVYFKSDYEALYSNTDKKAILFELKKIISDKSILFIGFSNTDPYVREIFDSINKLYEGLGPKHFLVTTEANFTHDYIKTLKINDYSTDLKELFDELITSKSSSVSVKKTTEVKSEEETKQNQEIIVNILCPEPIDKDYNLKSDLIQKCFQSYNVTIRPEYLSENSLRGIEEGYVFIFTKTVKDNLIIEDDYLKSKQISISDLCLELTEAVDGVFIFTDKKLDVLSESINIPLAIIFEESQVDFKLKDKLTSVNHKLFKQGIINSEVTLNKDKFKFYSDTKGTCRLPLKKMLLPKNLDIKLLNNFIGRKTDVENIIRKLIELEFENKILTIKGAGGIGKTTIISKAAIELTRRGFYKEIHFISCQSITTYDNFEYQISKCFNLDSSVELLDQISSKHTGKEKVIILDNFETVQNIEERDKALKLVADLCDYALIVCTTRQILNLDFEEVYELRNMTSFEGLELFKIYFKGKIESKDEEMLRTELVDELLNNNPLAIKLIAKGTLSSKELTSLRDELKDNIFNNDEIEKIFESPEDLNIEKSKSLYHSIKYSYDKLNDREKLAFEIISLFPDGIHFENFKIFIKKNNTKTQIGEKEIKSLDEKSLLEDNNGFLKLQSIINRFSYFHFQKRDEDIKQDYFTECYGYNSFFLSVFSSGKHFKPSSGLVLHDSNLNNYLKCIEVIDKVKNIEKDTLIDFIDDVVIVYRNINQYKDIIKVLENKFSYFEDVPNGKLALEIMILNLLYFTKEFDNAFTNIKERIPLSAISKYLKHKSHKDYNLTDAIIFTKAMGVYDCEGRTLEIIRVLMENDITHYYIEALVYKLGFLKLAKELETPDKDKSFFHFEIQLANGALTKEKLDEYIKQLYKKETLEIVQTNYTMLKLTNGSSKIDTSKLVITNPYTQGMIHLMNAVQESKASLKIALFKKALKELKHIKFYYLEALYAYVIYLKEIKNDEYLKTLEEGIQLSKKYNFFYLHHLFIKERDNSMDNYDENNIYEILEIEKGKMDLFIEKYKAARKKDNN